MKDKIYFHNLNGLRFFAAFMVIISHIELNKSYFSLKNNFNSIKYFGTMGLTLFFVLSGFLITFLLMKEKEKEVIISYKKFYFRRILRIWPLYYIIVILSLFILPHFLMFYCPGLHLNINGKYLLIKVILLFVFLLPNLLLNIKLIPFATQTWSIGTEEQFYLLWPIIINKFKNPKIFFLILIVSYYLLVWVVQFHCFDTIQYINLIRGYLSLFQIDSLTIGALGAYFLFHTSRFLKYLTHTYSFVTLIIILMCKICFNWSFYYEGILFYSLIFMVLILNLVHNPKLQNVLEYKALNYLGKISYGLYMYHQIVIVLVINLALKYGLYSNFLIFVFTLILTILVAALSYKYLESPFLKIKHKFSSFDNTK